MHKSLVHAQDSCACTTLLCMHWKGQGPRLGPKKSAGGPAWASAFFGSRPWSLAPPVHAQECCAQGAISFRLDTLISRLYTIIFRIYTITFRLYTIISPRRYYPVHANSKFL